MQHWRPLIYAIIGLVTLSAATLSVLGAGVQGTAHDFRSPANGGPNVKYPILAEIAGANPCAVCHTSHSAVFGKALFAADYGWEPSRKIRFESSGLCMSCHDGDLKTQSGQIIIDNPDLRIDRRHPRHRVEFPYPSRSGHLPTYALVEHDDRGNYWAVGSNGYRLPLEYDEQNGGTVATCITCHNAHDPGPDAKFLRIRDSKKLCWTCHSR